MVASLEPAALAFVAVCLLGWLVFALPGWLGAGLLGAALLALLLLAYVGARRPYFRATLSAFAGRFAHPGQGANVPMLRFDLLTSGQSQPVQVVMVGPWTPTGARVAPGETVLVRGMSEPSRNELHVWQIDRLDSSRAVTATLSAPRLIPLTVALFAPVVVMLLIRLLTLRA